MFSALSAGITLHERFQLFDSWPKILRDTRNFDEPENNGSSQSEHRVEVVVRLEDLLRLFVEFVDSFADLAWENLSASPSLDRLFDADQGGRDLRFMRVTEQCANGSLLRLREVIHGG